MACARLSFMRMRMACAPTYSNIYWLCILQLFGSNVTIIRCFVDLPVNWIVEEDIRKQSGPICAWHSSTCTVRWQWEIEFSQNWPISRTFMRLTRTKIAFNAANKGMDQKAIVNNCGGKTSGGNFLHELPIRPTDWTILERLAQSKRFFYAMQIMVIAERVQFT